VHQRWRWCPARILHVIDKAAPGVAQSVLGCLRPHCHRRWSCRRRLLPSTVCVLIVHTGGGSRLDHPLIERGTRGVRRERSVLLGYLLLMALMRMLVYRALRGYQVPASYALFSGTWVGVVVHVVSVTRTSVNAQVRSGTLKGLGGEVNGLEVAGRAWRWSRPSPVKGVDVAERR
jgi:hypothetical protein